LLVNLTSFFEKGDPAEKLSGFGPGASVAATTTSRLQAVSNLAVIAEPGRVNRPVRAFLPAN
jgi:hypothetical protein